MLGGRKILRLPPFTNITISISIPLHLTQWKTIQNKLICTYKKITLYIYIYIYTHTYIYIYIYIYIYTSNIKTKNIQTYPMIEFYTHCSMDM